MSTGNDQVGARLIRVREAQRLSQVELAKISGVANATISRIERGIIPNPGTGTMQKLSDALGVPVYELFPRSGQALLERIRQEGQLDLPESMRGPFARQLPRTMRAIPRDAPASVMDLLDRQVEGIVRLIFAVESRPAQSKQPAPFRHEKDGPVNDEGKAGGDGYFNSHTGTYGEPIVPLVSARELALV